jgi:hypothetical protein
VARLNQLLENSEETRAKLESEAAKSREMAMEWKMEDIYWFKFAWET